MCRSTNRQSEPEVWFRIVHSAQVGQNSAPAATYLEQTVEITLGAKGAFEDSNNDTLMCRVPADRTVSAVPPPRGKPRPPKGSKTPRVVELLRKAIEWSALLESGQVANQAEIARRENISRARVTQVMGMLCLAPEIQRHVLSIPDMVRPPAITERALRPIARMDDSKDHKARFQELVKQAE